MVKLARAKAEEDLIPRQEASQQSIIYVDRMLQIHFEVIAQFGSLI